MFRIIEDPLSGSLVLCLAKNYKNDSIVSVDMDKVGVMAAHSDPLCVCVVHCTWRHSQLHILHDSDHTTLSDHFKFKWTNKYIFTVEYIVCLCGVGGTYDTHGNEKEQ